MPNVGGRKMIDLHCHILHGVDDGAKSIEQALSMAKVAVADGISTIVATPHHRNGRYNNEQAEVRSQVAELNEHLAQSSIPLQVLPGQEIRIYDEIIEDLKEGKLLGLDPNNRYILLELPSQTVPPNLERIIYDILLLGYTPIIPHPERNSVLRDKPELLYRMVKVGALTQVTSTSLLGKFGKETEKFTREIIEHGLSHMIASDAHDDLHRAPKLQEAYEKLEKLWGYGMMMDYQKNCENIILGKRVMIDEPMRIKRKKLFGLF